MAKEVTKISPEGLEIANSYLQFGNIRAVSEHLCVPAETVAECLNKRDVKRYVDTVYLDLGYRNKNQIGTVLDEMIASKLEEAQEACEAAEPPIDFLNTFAYRPVKSCISRLWLIGIQSFN